VAAAFVNIFVDVPAVVQIMILSQATHDQAAASGDFAAIWRLPSRQNSQKGGFATSITSDEAESVSLIYGESGAVENNLLVIPHDHIRGIDQIRH